MIILLATHCSFGSAAGTSASYDRIFHVIASHHDGRKIPDGSHQFHCSLCSGFLPLHLESRSQVAKAIDAKSEPTVWFRLVAVDCSAAKSALVARALAARSALQLWLTERWKADNAQTIDRWVRMRKCCHTFKTVLPADPLISRLEDIAIKRS